MDDSKGLGSESEMNAQEGGAAEDVAAQMEALMRATDLNFTDEDLMRQLKDVEAEQYSEDEVGDAPMAEEDANRDPRAQDATWSGTDYDSPEIGFLFDYLKSVVRTACKVNTPPAARKAALQWIFVPRESHQVPKNIHGLSDDLIKEGLDFEGVCAALGARPTVLRARTQHQLWKAGVGLPEPLYVTAVPLPRGFEREILLRTYSTLCVEVAAYAWDWPSVDSRIVQTKLMMDGVTADDYHGAVEKLVMSGHLAVSSGCLYFIGRNPAVMSSATLSRFSFARSILFDYEKKSRRRPGGNRSQADELAQKRAGEAFNALFHRPTVEDESEIDEDGGPDDDYDDPASAGQGSSRLFG